MKIVSTLDLKTLVPISYTWCNCHSQHKEKSGKMKQLVEGERQKGPGDRGGS